MRSTDSSKPHASRADVLLQLSCRLEAAERLTAEMRAGLRDADAEAIDDAASRLRTLALECKLLHEEFQRCPAEAAGTTDSGLARASVRFEQTATRLAREAAVSGGLLERLVELSRRLIATIGTPEGDTYMASGRKREHPVGGVDLREMA